MTNGEILEQFENWLRSQRLSDSSCLSYKMDIRIFLKENEHILSKGLIDKFYCEDFINQQDISLSTQKRRYVSLRKFYAFTKEHPLLTMDKNFSLKLLQQEGMLTEIDILSPNEIDQLLELEVKPSFKEYRDKAIFETLYSTGIRLSELKNITMEDIDIIVGYVSFNRQYSRVTIPINRKYNPALMEYIHHYKTQPKSKKEFLFPNKMNEMISRQSIWKIVSSYAKKLFPDKNITPYGLRKSFAIHMFLNGASYEHISSIFGIKDLSFLLEQKTSTNEYGNFYKYHPHNKKSDQ